MIQEILFAVRSKTEHSTNYIITMAMNREEAKAGARQHTHMLGDPDSWDVIPITEPDARVTVDLSLK